MLAFTILVVFSNLMILLCYDLTNYDDINIPVSLSVTKKEANMTSSDMDVSSVEAEVWSDKSSPQHKQHLHLTESEYESFLV